MFSFTNRSLRYFLRLAILILICVSLAGLGLANLVAPIQAAEKEPIAYIGHGAMFDQKGQEVAPTITFIREAQAWYKRELLGKLTDNQRSEFNKFEQGLTKDLTLDEQSKLVLNTYLLDWLIDTTKVENADRIRGKNSLIRFLLKTKLSDNPDIRLPRSIEPFKVHPELLKRLTTITEVPLSH